MNIAAYMSQLAQKIGGVYVPKCTTFKETYQTATKHVVFGAYKGYLVALALTQAGRTAGFVMLVRYPRAPMAPPLQEALKARPGLSSFFGKKAVKVAVGGGIGSRNHALCQPKTGGSARLLDGGVREGRTGRPPFQ